MIRKLICVFSFLLLSSSALAQTEMTIVRPKAIDDVLVNPGMGVETFQRFNGEALNSSLRWSEEGPTVKLNEETPPPEFPGSSISYCRWFWNALEPEHGKVRWEIIDQALEEARTHGQVLAIRLMPYDEKHPLPEWYRNSGARRANQPADKDGEIWQPDFSDPLYLKYWGEVVAAAGSRYDGNPYLDSVDISSVGYWGEGWSDYMPAFPYQKALIDIWLEAFKRTPLLMNFDQEQALAYGTQQGAGWRLDCWGDMRDTTGGNWCHMFDLYPEQIVRAGIQDVWQRSPVSLETCWVPGYWKQKGWDVDYILAQALRWHVSSVNIKSSAIPPEWKDRFDDFQKKMGYRFVLRRLEYARRAKAGTMAPLHMWWLNAGVAPVYRPYELALQIMSPSGLATIKLPVDVRKWLPGDAVYDGSIYIPPTLKSGDYRLRVALLDPRTEQPAIRLATEGRQPDGWFDVGAVSIE